MTAALVRGDATAIPLADNTVDLVVTSPPYFSLREYRDGDEIVDGQIGSEPTPTDFLGALWSVADECWRVLKPSGVMFVNLGDKFCGSGGHNNAGISTAGSTLQGSLQQDRTGCPPEERRQAPRRYNQAADGRDKSLEGLPWRFALGLSHPQLYRTPFFKPGPQWIHRSELIWAKPNSIPESVTDRPSRTHEQWFMFTKAGRYFSAVDELRQPYKEGTADRTAAGFNPDRRASAGASNNGVHRTIVDNGGDTYDLNPLGAAPRSVWSIPSEPLIVPEWLEVDHFAAFPQEWPRRLILGFSPPGICTVCGEGRRPAVESVHHVQRQRNGSRPHKQSLGGSIDNGLNADGYPVTSSENRIVGYVCRCCPHTIHRDRRRPTVTPGAEKRQNGEARDALGEPRRHGDDWPRRKPRVEWHLHQWTPPPVTGAVVLDPFAGTGTVPMVARALGRTGIGLDLSAAYLKLATWRIFHSGHGAKTEARTWAERQGALL